MHMTRKLFSPRVDCDWHTGVQDASSACIVAAEDIERLHARSTRQGSRKQNMNRLTCLMPSLRGSMV